MFLKLLKARVYVMLHNNPTLATRPVHIFWLGISVAQNPSTQTTPYGLLDSPLTTCKFCA